MKKTEFSKILMIAIMSTYFLGLVIGIYVVLRILLITPEYSVQALIAMLSYIGAPVGIAIPFYFNKSKTENLHKYTQGTFYNDYIYDEAPSDEILEDAPFNGEEDFK